MSTKDETAPEKITIIGGASGTIEIEVADNFVDSLTPEEIQQLICEQVLTRSENTPPR